MQFCFQNEKCTTSTVVPNTIFILIYFILMNLVFVFLILISILVFWILSQIGHHDLLRHSMASKSFLTPPGGQFQWLPNHTARQNHSCNSSPGTNFLYFSLLHCWNKIPDTHNWKEKFILALGSILSHLASRQYSRAEGSNGGKAACLMAAWKQRQTSSQEGRYTLPGHSCSDPPLPTRSH